MKLLTTLGIAAVVSLALAGCWSTPTDLVDLPGPAEPPPSSAAPPAVEPTGFQSEAQKEAYLDQALRSQWEGNASGDREGICINYGQGGAAFLQFSAAATMTAEMRQWGVTEADVQDAYQKLFELTCPEGTLP